METTALSTTQEALLQAKDIIAQNIASNEKAKEVAKILLAKIENTPISDTPEVRFLDEECKTFLGKISKTISAMTDRRKPITQAFDQIRKHFTELENELKTGEEIQAIQNFRNAFARHIAEIAAKEEEARRIKAATEQERIEMRAYFKQAFTKGLVNTLSLAYDSLEEIFNSITLQNCELKKDELKNFSSEYKPATFSYPYRNYITKEEEIAIYEEIASSKSAKNELEYNEKITEKIRYYLDRVDSKKQELLEIAQANAAEKERLAKEAEERAKREAEEKIQELLNFTQKQQTSIKAEKTEAYLNTLFDQNYSAPEANVKKTLSIEVSNPAGYGQIFMFWFEREGKNLPNEKIEKKSIAQMKKFCEDIANKDGEIITSNFITYKEVVTAK